MEAAADGEHQDQKGVNSMKKSYAAPALTTFGNATELTQGNSTGLNLDKTFPINTPKNKLTFSGGAGNHGHHGHGCH
jgi:hypothetical protein